MHFLCVLQFCNGGDLADYLQGKHIIIACSLTPSVRMIKMILCPVVYCSV